MRDGLLTLQCPHGTTAHGCTEFVDVAAVLRWFRAQAAVHRQQVGCACASGQIRIGGGA